MCACSKPSVAYMVQVLGWRWCHGCSSVPSVAWGMGGGVKHGVVGCGMVGIGKNVANCPKIPQFLCVKCVLCVLCVLCAKHPQEPFPLCVSQSQMSFLPPGHSLKYLQSSGDMVHGWTDCSKVKWVCQRIVSHQRGSVRVQGTRKANFWATSDSYPCLWVWIL